jgi:MFS family permease
MLAQLGRGMLVPIVPLYLLDSGLTYTMISVILAATGLGAIIGGLPIGKFAGRSGPELLFVGSTLATTATAALFGVSTAVLALIVFRLVYGMGAVGLRVSVQMLIRDALPPESFGRGFSGLGGAIRFASFLGPLLGGAAADLAGFSIAFALSGALSMAALVPFWIVRSNRPSGQRFDRPEVPLKSLRSALASHGKLIALAGIGPALVLTVRTGRQTVVPLIGDDLGLGATAVGALVAVGTLADLLLFPVSGFLMDRFGRLFAIVPAFSLLAFGMLILGLSSTTGGVVLAGVVMGVGNGMSAGTMFTLGADLAPKESGPFLAAMGMMQDIGVVIGPLLVGWLADSVGLTQSALVMSVVMFFGIAWIVIAIGDTAKPSRPWLVPLLENHNSDPSNTMPT